jgi:hypothetical protein
MRFRDLPPEIRNKLQFWQKTIEATKDFTGSSPPSVFVGDFGYPRVNVGILAPPQQQAEEKAFVLDSPESWYANKISLEQIFELRSQLIYSRFKSSVHADSGSLVDVTKEIAAAKKPMIVDIELKRQPRFLFATDARTTPIGNPAPLVSARLAENPSVEKKVDYLISDVDVKATRAVLELYKHKLPATRIQKVFSAGLLGMQVERKFVPTRWSITAVDDILGKNLREKVKDYQEIGEIKLFFNEYIGNRYYVLLLPGAYQFELIEFWQGKWGMPAISSDYENFWGRKDYANNTHGAFYSGRLAVCEHLEKMKRQASILIVREITSEYSLPVGIWQLREAVRDAFNQQEEKFATLKEAIARIESRMKLGSGWQERSELLKNFKHQKKLTAFGRKI